MSQALDFFACWFGATTTEPVYICSLANERNDDGEPGEQRVATRNPSDVEAFAAKWDRPKRGLFFCVSTIKPGQKRNKENVAEVPGLWADIDLKDVIETRDSILKRLKTLPKPPSIVIDSGNGLHVYWRFKEAITINIIDGADTVERIEAALRLLADTVGGDTKVCEISRLMRLPGSHNSKRGEWKDVNVIEVGVGAYELDDVEDMLSVMSPIALRKERPSVEPTNPFLAYAAELHGYKPPIDVEKRLAAMRYMGSGDAAIHDTQLAVTASLINAGREIDEVVAVVLEATRVAAGEYGERWNWKREEKAIRKMCESWLKKNPPTKPTPKIVSGGGSSGTATVLKIEEARAKKEKPKSQTVIDRANMHVMIGDTLLKRLQAEGTPILIITDQIWRYREGVWSAVDGKGRHWLDSEIENCIRQLEQTSTLKLTAEVRGWIYRNPDIQRDNINWDDHGKIAVRGGLIDPVTHEFTPAKPEHHVTARIECVYDAEATCPMWLEMLATTFADRPLALRQATIDLIQEVLGCAMVETKSKALSRALVFHGLSNTGKTDLIKTISGLLTDRPISTPLSALEGAHGLMEFTRNAPWVLHEAFDAQKWHFSSVAKSILSGDPVSINPKNGALITKRIQQAVIWGTNVPPQFKEATRAIVNRMVVITCRTVFDPKKPVGLAVTAKEAGFSEPSEMILAREKQGLLNWALAGLRRALQRGFFETTEEIEETLESIRLDSNVVAGFMTECVSYSPNYMVTISDFCAAFSVWWGESKGELSSVPSNETIGRQLAAYGDARVGIDAKALRNTKHRFYAGLHLNDIGMAYWNGASMEGLAKGKTARTSTNAADVNRYIPQSWEQLPVILSIKKASMTGSECQSDEDSGSSVIVIKKHDKEPRF